MQCYPCIAQHKADPKTQPKIRDSVSMAPIVVNGALVTVPACYDHCPAAPKPMTLEEMKKQANAALEAQYAAQHPGGFPVPDSGLLRPAGQLAVVTGDDKDLKAFRGGKRT